MEIRLFNSPQFGDVRMSAKENGEPLFCATDVAKALGYSNPRDAVARNCKSGGVVICDTPTTNQFGATVMQPMKYITEGNLYRLIARSNLPEAEKFESWIFDEVVPAIRMTGGYIQARPEDTPEEIMAKAVLLAKKTIEAQNQKLQMLEGKNALLEQENRELAPKAQYTDDVLQSKNTYTHTEMAKELNFRSWISFVDACKKDGILFKHPGGMYMLYSKYAGKGYMKTRTNTFSHKDGTIGTSVISVWTEEGRMFLHEHFNVALQPIDLTMFPLTEKDI